MCLGLYSWFGGWRNKLFSDESKLNIFSSDGKVKPVSRLAGSKQTSFAGWKNEEKEPAASDGECQEGEIHAEDSEGVRPLGQGDGCGAFSSVHSLPPAPTVGIPLSRDFTARQRMDNRGETLLSGSIIAAATCTTTSGSATSLCPRRQRSRSLLGELTFASASLSTSSGH